MRLAIRENLCSAAFEGFRGVAASRRDHVTERRGSGSTLCVYTVARFLWRLIGALLAFTLGFRAESSLSWSIDKTYADFKALDAELRANGAELPMLPKPALLHDYPRNGSQLWAYSLAISMPRCMLHAP